MPTPNPRLSVIVSDDQRALLGRLGALQGHSAAWYVRELIDAATPSLRALLGVLERAKVAEGKLPDAIAAASAEIAARLQPFEQANVDQLDLIADVLERHGFDDASIAVADMIPRERSDLGSMAAPEPEEAARPPYGNTGVKTHERPSKARKAVGRGA